MRHAQSLVPPFRWQRTLRPALEYAAAVGLAILSSYWIVRVRW